MNNPLDFDAIRKRAEDAAQADGAPPWAVQYDGSYYVQATNERNGVASDMCEETAEFLAHAIVDVPALVAEVERLHTISADLVALVQPILDRTKDQIGTHSDRCFEYHVACLAGLVRTRLDAGSQTEGADRG